MISQALGGEALPQVLPGVKVLKDCTGMCFPVLFCTNRQHRPFRKTQAGSREDCPLCMHVRTGHTTPALVKGMAWLPATWPIKSFHGICFPAEHRASILAKDIFGLGEFVERVGDAVACINLRGSAASIPEHFHAQIHDCALPATTGEVLLHTAFPLLLCEEEPVARCGSLTLVQFPTYPAFVLCVQGPWDLLGRWLTTYLAASNSRPHNFALAWGRRLFVIPRGLERAPGQENRYGASEMLGLIAPVTQEAYDAIDHGDIIAEALRVCGAQDPRDRTEITEHVLWTTPRSGYCGVVLWL